MHPPAASPDPGSIRGDGPGLLRAIETRLADVRLLTDVTDRKSYRRDETAYFEAGLRARGRSRPRSTRGAC